MQKTACENTYDRRHNNFSKSVEKGGFLQNSQGGAMGKFSKMSDFLGKLWKTKKIGTTGHIIA